MFSLSHSLDNDVTIIYCEKRMGKNESRSKYAKLKLNGIGGICALHNLVMHIATSKNICLEKRRCFPEIVERHK